eukprot:87409_1
MTAKSKYSTVITILYASIYGLIFFVSSIIAAVQVRKIRKVIKRPPKHKAHNTKFEEDTKLKDNNETIALETKSNESDEEKNRTDAINNSQSFNPKQDPTYSKNIIKHWAKLVWSKKKVYWGLVPHIFDQATDISVAVEYWIMYKNDVNVTDTNPLYFFMSTVFFLLLHRIVSTVTLYYLTRNPMDALLQSFDLLLIKAIWTNYKLGSNEPSNIQRYLGVLEATFESSPQIAISTVFILKSSGNNAVISPIIIVSICFSLWSLISRVISDDKKLFAASWQSLDFDRSELSRCSELCRCSVYCDEIKIPLINIRFLWRLFWRSLEISNRVFVCTLLWINIGGFGLIIIISIEFIWCVCLCVAAKTPDAMGNIMYLAYSFGKDKEEQINWYDDSWRARMVTLFWLYRVVTFYIYMIIITVFSCVSFEAEKVEEFQTRNNITIQTNLGLFMFIYGWVTGPLWHSIGW